MMSSRRPLTAGSLRLLFLSVVHLAFSLAFLSFGCTAYLALEIQLQNEPADFPASPAIAPAGPQTFLSTRWSGSKSPQFLVSRPRFCICF